MAAVYLLRVQPVIRAAGDFGAQLIILHIVSTDEDLKAVVRAVEQRPLRLELFRFSLLLLFQITGLGQFPSQLCQILFTLGALDLIQHALQIIQLLFSLRQKHTQMPGRRLELIVLLIHRRRVLLRRFQRVERDLHLGQIFLIVVFTQKLAIAFFQPVEIGRQKLRLFSQLFAAFRAPVFLTLKAELSLQAVPRRAHGTQQIMAAAALSLGTLPLGVEGVEHAGEGLTAAVFHASAVLPDLHKAEIARLAVFQQHRREEFLTADPLDQSRKLRRKGIIGIAAAEGKLPADQRRQTGKMIQQPAVDRDRAIGRCDKAFRFFCALLKNTAFILGGRHAV